MKHLSLMALVVLALIGALAVSCRDNRLAEAWKVDRDSVLARVQAREVSADSLKAVGESLMGIAKSRTTLAERQLFRGEQAYRSALSLRDSLLTVQIPDTCLPLAAGWRRTNDSLLVALGATREANASLEAAVAQMDSAYWAQAKRGALLQESVDSLTSLIRRAPGRKWYVPQLQVGYGAVLNGGMIRTGPSVGVGLRIPF